MNMLGITLKKTFLYKERDEAQRKKFVEHIAKHSHQPLVYIDESGFDEQIVREYGRAPRCEKVMADKKGMKTKRINMIAGLLNKKMIAPDIYEFQTTAKFLNSWLERCLLPKLPKQAVIIMDNAAFHKTKTTQDIIEQHGHRLLYLPPYSPDSNPIEQYWAIIKSKIRKLGHIDNLCHCIKMALQTI